MNTVSPLSIAQGEHQFNKHGLHAIIRWAYSAVFVLCIQRHLIKALRTFDFLHKCKECLLTVKKKIGKIDGQRGAINTTNKGEWKNRPLIEPAIAISQKDKLHFKARDSRYDSAVCFVFPPSAMFRKHIFMHRFKLSSRCSMQC